MSESSKRRSQIPVLTDVVPDEPDEPNEPTEEHLRLGYPSDVETLIAELQTKLAASTFALTEQLLHATFSEMEATVFQQVSAKLRQELPELIDSVLRQHLGADDEAD